MALIDTPSNLSIIVALSIAAIGGGLIGLERERHAGSKHIYAGIRTLPLVSISGALTYIFSIDLNAPIILLGGIVIFGVMSLYMAHLQSRENSRGLTSPLAFFIAFMIGALAGSNHLFESIALAIATTFLLSIKEALHDFATIITRAELESTLYFLAIAILIYPFAPDTPLWASIPTFIPREALTLVLTVSAMSFVVFIAMRKYGPSKGLPLSGLLGGLVNSEAAATTLLQTHKQQPELPTNHINRAIFYAMTTTMLRGLIITTLADPSMQLTKQLILPFTAIGLIFGIKGYLSVKKTDAPINNIRLRIGNPFALKPAFKFTAIFIAVSILAHFIQQTPSLGTAGTYLLSLGGLVSAGSVLAALAVLVANQDITLNTATITSLLAMAISIANKPLLARALKYADYNAIRRTSILGIVVGTIIILFYLVIA